MTITAGDVEPHEPFRLSMLVYDKRYRSYFLQIITLFLLMALVGWLVLNVSLKFAELGKEFSFGYLWAPASYDINQRLIEYTSQSPHWRAGLVGLLNTLVIAVLGCFLATILGVLIGVARLSKNWLVSRLMTIYIEGFRNVPVLLWILLASTLFSAALPAPRQAEPALNGFLTSTNRGFYIPSPIFRDGTFSVIATFVLSVIAIFALRWWARNRQTETGQTFPVLRASLAILIVPTFLVFFAQSNPSGFDPEFNLLYGNQEWTWLPSDFELYLLGREFGMNGPIGLEFSALKGFNFQGGLFIRSSFMALWLALSLYTAAFIAENVRSGIQAISAGQTEAAYSLGLPPERTMNLVILPQALRIIIPPLISQYLNLTKNSSLAIAVGYMDLTGTLGGITLNQTGKEMENLLIVMGIYLIISLAISAAMNVYNSAMAIRER